MTSPTIERGPPPLIICPETLSKLMQFVVSQCHLRTSYTRIDYDKPSPYGDPNWEYVGEPACSFCTHILGDDCEQYIYYWQTGSWELDDCVHTCETCEFSGHFGSIGSFWCQSEVFDPMVASLDEHEDMWRRHNLVIKVRAPKVKPCVDVMQVKEGPVDEFREFVLGIRAGGVEADGYMTTLAYAANLEQCGSR